MVISPRTRNALVFAFASALAFLNPIPAFAVSAKSQVVVRELRSENIAHNKTGTDPVRKMLVYLPAGYDPSSSQRYAVIYFLPNPFEESYRFDFDHRDAQGLFDRAIADGVIKKFILVAVDMNTPLGSSWYVNSSATGNWEDFMIQELVPYIDGNFKTLPNRDSRGIAGIFIGGYGAIRFGMRHPNVFGTVYAMHPVGTGTGVGVSMTIPKWDILTNAKSMDDVKKDGGTRIFTTMFQAHLPGPDKPPLFIELLARQENDRLIIDAKLMDRFRNNFYLETMIPQYADNLKSLRGFKFDWTRNDANFDHVYANQAFTRKLNEFGIAHGAEEYTGPFDESNWGVDGRIYTEVLPFFQKHMVFAEKNEHSQR
jgi:Putative esterase